MAAVEPVGSPGGDRGSADVAALIPLVRRIVASRVPDPATADDLVQETLARVLAAAGRVEPGMLEPYAIVTARNVVISMWRDRDRQRRHQHRVVDLRPPEAPDEDVLAREDRAAVAEALSRLSDRERTTLLAHEVSGQDTRSLAAELGSTAGAVAAQLNRTRARLRVEYLLVSERVERRRNAAVRCCWPSPAAIAAASARSTPLATCSSATCARGCPSRWWNGGGPGTTPCVSPCAPTPTSSLPGRSPGRWPPGWASPPPTSR
ncbi:sigma-70 family RNA polymerase sigma factor [Geodermatophilus sp. SYSU D01176]